MHLQAFYIAPTAAPEPLSQKGPFLATLNVRAEASESLERPLLLPDSMELVLNTEHPLQTQGFNTESHVITKNKNYVSAALILCVLG